jgi:hypothetical protein
VHADVHKCKNAELLNDFNIDHMIDSHMHAEHEVIETTPKARDRLSLGGAIARQAVANHLEAKAPTRGGYPPARCRAQDATGGGET